MKTAVQRLRLALLAALTALGVFLGGTQQAQAKLPTAQNNTPSAYYPYYNYYYNAYNSWLNLYNLVHNACYFDTAYAFYFYYISGRWGDRDAWTSDPYGYYSDQRIQPFYYRSFTYHDNTYNYYAYVADYYWHLCH